MAFLVSNFCDDGNFGGGCLPEDGVPDMTVISDIDEKGINTNLKTRYKRDHIYVSFSLFWFLFIHVTTHFAEDPYSDKISYKIRSLIRRSLFATPNILKISNILYSHGKKQRNSKPNIFILKPFPVGKA
ncbi:hypothetical protein CEXT_101931 [Caerostris extrusa]|uniref:Uncharacterized protein n=1 Tax=Caerostris extrusa TaxID=172846 RepID=A0AAV4Y831_CAEEX|nr:hypothetical protein CEXT_101931 [Caerostris extrusa]